MNKLLKTIVILLAISATLSAEIYEQETNITADTATVNFSGQSESIPDYHEITRITVEIALTPTLDEFDLTLSNNGSSALEIFADTCGASDGEEYFSKGMRIILSTDDSLPTYNKASNGCYYGDESVQTFYSPNLGALVAGASNLVGSWVLNINNAGADGKNLSLFKITLTHSAQVKQAPANAYFRIVYKYDDDSTYLWTMTKTFGSSAYTRQDKDEYKISYYDGNMQYIDGEDHNIASQAENYYPNINHLEFDLIGDGASAYYVVSNIRVVGCSVEAEMMEFSEDDRKDAVEYYLAKRGGSNANGGFWFNGDTVKGYAGNNFDSVYEMLNTFFMRVPLTCVS
jgi:hypothetical protein